MNPINKIISMLCLLLMGQMAWSQRADGIGHVTLLKKNQQAQAKTSRTGHVTLLKKNALRIYVGGGSENPGTAVKDAAHLNKLLSISEEIYKPLWTRNHCSIGLNIGGQYLLTNSEPLETLPQPFHINGETSSTVAVQRSGNPSAQGFKLGIGPQASFHLGKRFVISPIVNLGYMNITQKAFSATQTSDVNATIYQFDLIRQTETKMSGMALMPKLRLEYFFTSWLGIWAEAAYTSGPTINTVTDTFAPNGPILTDTNDYELQSIQTGTYNQTKTETKYSAIGINAGLVFAIGGTGHNTEPQTTETNDYVGHVTLLKKNQAAMVVDTKANDDPCVVIESPAFGSSYSKKQNLVVKASTIDGVEKVNLTLYKISQDEQLFRTADDATRKQYFSDDYRSGKPAIASDAKSQKITSIDAEVKNNKISQTISKESLSAGSYRLVVSSSNGCQNSVTNFTVSNDDCDFTHMLSNVSETCNGIYEQGGFKHRVTFTSNYTSSNCNLSFAQPGSGLKVYDSSMNALAFTAVTGFPLQVQNNGSTTAKTYTFDVIVPTASTNVIIALQGDSCPNMAVHCIPGAQKKFEVKNCACQPCDQNRVILGEVSSAANGDIFRIVNKFTARPNAITKIQADIVYMSITPQNADCVKCNNKSVQQGNFTDMNQITQGNVTLWEDSGKGKIGGENTNANLGRSVTFTSMASAGVDLSPPGINITNTVGLPPAGCCGDQVEIWIRYTVWDKDCHACDKLVKKIFTREASCEANTTEGTPSGTTINSK